MKSLNVWGGTETEMSAWLVKNQADISVMILYIAGMKPYRRKEQETGRRG